MKKRVLLIALIGVTLIGGSIVGGTLAARNASTKDNAMTSEGTITTNDLQISLLQDVEKKQIYVNQPVEVKYTVVANENNGYDCFTRLMIEKGSEYQDSALEVLPIGENASDWIIIDPFKNYTKIADKYQDMAVIDAEHSEMYQSLSVQYRELAERYANLDLSGFSEDYIYLYYRNSLSKGESAECNLQVVFTADHKNINYSEQNTIAIDATADAVQTYAAADAIASEWGMFAEINSDNTRINCISDTPLGN